MSIDRKLYVHAFMELVDEIIKENRDNPERAKKLIVEEVLREARKVFRLEDYQEIKMYAFRKLMELGFSAKELEELLEK